MTRHVQIRRLAESHLAEAYAWYERQSPGLGTDFLDRFAAVESQLTGFAEAFPIVFLDYRRALLKKFPFGVFFVIENNVVIVAAVYHLARDPRTIREHLGP